MYLFISFKELRGYLSPLKLGTEWQYWMLIAACQKMREGKKSNICKMLWKRVGFGFFFLTFPFQRALCFSQLTSILPLLPRFCAHFLLSILEYLSLSLPGRYITAQNVHETPQGVRGCQKRTPQRWSTPQTSAGVSAVLLGCEPSADRGSSKSQGTF